MENSICLFCNQLCEELMFLQCKHPICSKCAQTQFSSEMPPTPCDHFPLKSEHKQMEGKQTIHDEKKTFSICCPKCNEKTILIFSQGDIKLANDQQLSAVDDGLGENQQQQYIPDEMFQWMSQFLNAKELFKKIRFTCNRVDKIVCTSLLSLHCQGLSINLLKFAREILAKETQLQELNLMANNIDDNKAIEIAKAFPLMQQLQTLDLSWNQIRNTGVIAIANSVKYLTQLQVLDISCNPIEDSARTTISNATKELTTLQHVEIYEKCSQLIYERVCQVFNQKGIKLNLNSCNIDNACAIALAKVLPHFTQLQMLYLDCNRIGYNGAIEIANSINKLTQLQGLYLSNNQIGDTGATAIANSISNFTQLKRLHFNNNQIEDTGATAIANSISKLTQLQVLCLDDNRIGDTGAIAIANSISNLTQLHQLSFDYNQIGDTSATAIANSINKLTQLQVLCLDDNRIGDTGAIAIASSFSNLTQLQQLYLFNNNTSEPVKQQLKQQFGARLCI